MENLEAYFELVKLRSQVIELTYQNEELPKLTKDRISVLYQLKRIIQDAGLSDSVISKKIEQYIDQFEDDELNKKEVFEKQVPVILATIDELKYILFERRVNNESAVWDKKIAEQEEKLKQSGFVLETYYQSTLSKIQMVVLAALIVFGIYGVFKINDLSVDVKQISKEKIEDAKSKIDEAARKAQNEIDNLNRSYQADLYKIVSQNSDQYRDETNKFVASEKERIKNSVNTYILDVENTAKPAIDQAIGGIQRNIGADNEKLKNQGDAIQTNLKELQILDAKINDIKEKLISVNNTFEKFKTTPTLSIVDKISSIIDISKTAITCVAISILIMLIWIVILSIRLSRHQKMQLSA